MKNRHFILLAAALLIGAEGATIAARTTSPSSATTQTTTQQKAKPAVYHRMGTIASLTDSDLVLEHKWKGKEENTKFVLNSDTKKEGELNKGEMATVYYHMDNKQRIATEVKVTQPKSTTEPKKS
jgi:outer membrane biogenesis lipoprotein LolB